MDPFTIEQQAAIRAVIEAEVARAVQAERSATTFDMGAWVRGAVRSWTVWSGALLVALPELLDAIAPLVTEQWGADVWRRVVQITGVVIVLLRIKTTDSIPEKGAQS